MPVIRAADAPTFTPHGASIVAAAAPSRGSTQVCLWRVRVQPGASIPAHVLDHEEVFHVLGGEIVATLDGMPQTIRSGDTLVVPPGMALGLDVPADQSFEAICAAPAGLRARFAAGGEPFQPPWTI